jgi:diacylglycerol kinase family enzyme
VNIVVLKNKKAGKGKLFSREPDLKTLFGDYDLKADIIECPGSSIKNEMQSILSKNPDVIAVSGGDGTISSAAQYLINTEIALGIIPSGTLNHFAKDAGIPLNTEAAIKTIAKMNIKRIDTAEVNGRYFINNSSIGIYPKAVKQRDRHIEFGKSKWIAMGQALFTIFKKLPMIDVKIKSDFTKVYCKTPIVFIGNNEYKTDLFHAGVRHSLTTGKLSLFYPVWTSRFSLLRYAFLGLINRLKDEKDFHTLDTEEITIETLKKEIAVALDGEVIHLQPPLKYQIHPLSLKIIVPKNQE